MNIYHFDRYFPYGINRKLDGAATIFFAYIDFDTIASTAEKVCFGLIILCYNIKG